MWSKDLQIVFPVLCFCSVVDLQLLSLQVKSYPYCPFFPLKGLKSDQI